VGQSANRSTVGSPLLSSTVFTISIRDNANLCLDIEKGHGAGGDTVQIWECNGQESQLWYFDPGSWKIQWAGNRTKCIDAGDQSPGTQLVLADCSGATGQTGQKWGFDGTTNAIFLAADDGGCSLSENTDRPGNDIGDGTPNVKGLSSPEDCCDHCSANPACKAFAFATKDGGLFSGISKGDCWFKTAEGEPKYKDGITSGSATGDYSLCMDLAGASKELGTAVQLWDCNGLWEQNWLLSHGITIRVMSDYHFCLDVWGGEMKKGSKVQLWECNGYIQQKWVWDSGSYAIKSASNTSLCIDAGEGMVGGTELMLWDCNGLPQQSFGFDPNMQTIYLSQSTVDASSCLDVTGGEIKNGGRMEIWECNSCWNQQFQVIGPAVSVSVNQADKLREPKSLWSSFSKLLTEPSVSTSNGCPAMPHKTKPSKPEVVKVLGHCESGVDQHHWPVFKTKKDLERSYWKNYIKAVYGEIPTTGYPICTMSLSHLYKPILASAGVSGFLSQFSFDHPESSSCPSKDGQYYSLMTDHQNPWSTWVWNPNLQQPQAYAATGLPGDHWVEILHQAYSMDGAATWMYYTPGTAIWFNLGNTKMWNDHDLAVQELLNEACQAGGGWAATDHECIPQFPRMYQAAINAGYDSMQFQKHADMPCGVEQSRQNMAIEIVDLGGPGTNSCGMSFQGGTSGKSRYRAGWEAKYECDCDNTQKTVNCKGYGINYARAGAAGGWGR